MYSFSQPRTATALDWQGDYLALNSSELSTNGDKVLMNIGGVLTWVDFDEFIDNIASHLTG